MSGHGATSGFRGTAAFQALLLGGFAMLAAVILAAANLATRDAIEQRRAEDLRASIDQVIPPRLYDNNLLDDVVTVPGAEDAPPMVVYQAQRKGRVVAVAYRVSGFGYGGEIVLIMGVDRSGQILGVRVLSHSETPGLGDRIEAAKDDWILGFAGLSLGNPPPGKWKVKKDGGRFDQFSGATISPRAVVKAVKEGLQFFAYHRDTLLAPVAHPGAAAEATAGNATAASTTKETQ
jgi:electron transport complex protein RnfG